MDNSLRSRREATLDLAAGAFAGASLLLGCGDSAQGDTTRSRWKLSQIPFDGQAAHDRLVQICALGPRVSGSQPMLDQQAMLKEWFEGLGAKVSMQEFQVRHPETGKVTTLANMIVEFHPERTDRVMLCCHYDTRPFADEDPVPKNRTLAGAFQGANDATASVALLMEMGKKVSTWKTPVGVDFVFFDAEEFIFVKRRDPFFLGSKHYANEFVANPPAHRYRAAVLLDMIAGENLMLFQETNSARWTDTRPIVKEIWGTAKRLDVREFIPRTRHEVNDDHVPLHDIAKIPCVDVIDFDYRDHNGRKFWHTLGDTPERCSPLSMAKVGWVIEDWIKSQK